MEDTDLEPGRNQNPLTTYYSKNLTYSLSIFCLVGYRTGKIFVSVFSQKFVSQSVFNNCLSLLDPDPNGAQCRSRIGTRFTTYRMGPPHCFVISAF